MRGLLEVNRFDSAEAVHTYFKNHYGPTIEAYANIGHNRVLAAELDAQLVELAQQYLADGIMDWEYLLVTAEKLLEVDRRRPGARRARRRRR